MQKIIISGHLGRDAEVKNINNKFVMEFSVAVSEKYNGENHTTWYKISSWSDNEPKVANYLKKGQPVIIEGKPNIETYINKNTGEAVGQLKIDFPKIELFGKSSLGNDDGNVQQQQTTQNQVEQNNSNDPDPFGSGPTNDLPW